MSRYQACPICGCNVAAILINDHLDQHVSEDVRPKKARKLIHSPQPLASVIFTNAPDKRKHEISDADLAKHTPLDVVRSILPAELADEVLCTLLQHSEV